MIIRANKINQHTMRSYILGAWRNYFYAHLSYDWNAHNATDLIYDI